MPSSSGRAKSTVIAESQRDFVRIEVVYALPERQVLLKVRVPAGTSLREAVKLSGIRGQFPQIDLQKDPLGIFGKKVKGDVEVKDGDRIEIYRPLLADPREVRRQLAAQGKTMGRKRAD